MDTTFREVLSQLSQADLVRLLPCFPSASAKPSMDITHMVSETLTTVMQQRVDAPMDTPPEPEGTTALVFMSSPVCRAITPPQAFPIPDILATGTPAGQPFLHLPLVSSTRNRTVLLAVYLRVTVARELMLALRKALSVVGTALHPSS